MRYEKKQVTVELRIDNIEISKEKRESIENYVRLMLEQEFRRLLDQGIIDILRGESINSIINSK